MPITRDEIVAILDTLRQTLAQYTEKAGASRIKVGDTEIEYDVREITRLIDYYENLLARLDNRTTIVKGLSVKNAF